MKTKTIYQLIAIAIATLFLLVQTPTQAISLQTFDCETQTNVPKVECEVLVVFYYANPNANFPSNWLADSNPCNWEGVVCFSWGAVQKLVLQNMQIDTIPTEIKDFYDLEIIDFSNNNIAIIPSSIGHLWRLHTLNLQGNQISKLPSTIGDLGSLQVLWLENNQINALPTEITNLDSRLAHLSLANNNLLTLPQEIFSLIGLYRLSLDNNQLDTISSEIGQIEYLKILELSNNQIAQLPPEIGNLAILEVLNLTNNQLTQLPSEIGNLTELTWLSLYGNQLTQLPPEIGQLSNLSELYVSYNELTTVPTTIGSLTNLTKLYFYDNNLTQIPSSIGNLTNLETLQLAHNQLTEIPTEIGSLGSLTWLSFENNEIAATPSTIGQLSSLQTLVLTNNQLTSVPAEIGDLSSLTWLSLNENQLTSLPVEIGQLSNLSELYVADNNLSSVPLSIGNLSSLTSLRLDGNQITQLPSEIGQLSNLTVLTLVNNQLQTLPSEIGQLSNLVTLFLGINQLTTLPTTFYQLESLVLLDLTYNLLSNISPQINQMTALQTLWLNDNQLAGLPGEIGDLQQLQTLFINSNPISGPIPDNFVNLTNLNSIHFHSTGLCVPDTAAFTNWLDSIALFYESTGQICGREGARISGTVQTPSGQAVQNAQILVYRRVFPDDTIVVSSTSTSANGEYTIDGLGEEIDYYVHVSVADANFAPQFYGEKASLQFADPISLTLGTTRENVDFTLGVSALPLAAVAADKGGYATNPIDGTVEIYQANGQRSDVTITTVVRCNNDTTPIFVNLTFNDNIYPMSQTGNTDEYEVTIPSFHIATGGISVVVGCNGAEETTKIGAITLFDPSGYITNAETGQPVVGAKVTLYQVPNWRPRKNATDMGVNSCESNLSKASGAAWSQEAPVAQGALVNTTITTVSPLVNTQITDGEGYYGWDVPEGCWYVTVEAEGYEDLVSPVVGVPTEVTDLDLVLTPLGGSSDAQTTIFLPMIRR